MCHAVPFSARPLKKNISFDVDIVVKTNRNVVYRGLYCYRQRVRVITLSPNIFVRIVSAYCWFSHDVTKFQTLEILILLKFYFHAV